MTNGIRVVLGWGRPPTASRFNSTVFRSVAAATVLSGVPGAATSQSVPCDFHKVNGAVWWGPATRMPLSQVAAYLAPVFWFSPDEPLLQRTSGAAIRIPEAMPGEPPAEGPVVYYEVREVLTRPDAMDSALVRDPNDPGASTIDITAVGALTLTYYAYFSSEEGLGAHPHDVEPAEFKVVMLQSTYSGFEKVLGGKPACKEPTWVMGITRSTGKAHGLFWYWNVLDTDDDTWFPMHILVEEGKHGLATDKNGDGVFTPGYDVNVRINDAWGVRDIIRTGMLFTGGFQAWMAKVRTPPYQVLPPLPKDSPLADDLALRNEGYTLAVYQLRPYPSQPLTTPDHAFNHLVNNHLVPGWPDEARLESIKEWKNFVEEGAARRSLSIAYRYDGQSGFSWVFPFFIVANLNDPLTGGYILQRMYAEGPNLETFGWMALYTASASRWLDGYLSAGAEFGQETNSAGQSQGTTNFVFETGVKFRANVEHSPAKFLSFLTPLWGLRAGLKYTGAFSINKLSYVVEVGAGAF